MIVIPVVLHDTGIPKSTKSTVQKYRRLSEKMDAFTERGARNVVMATGVRDATQAVVIEDL